MDTHFDEKGKIFTNVVSTQILLAQIQTQTHRILGYVHVRPGSRLKDELNQPEQFLAVTDAVVYAQDGSELYSSEFMAVNRDHIIWVIPEDEPSDPSLATGGAG